MGLHENGERESGISVLWRRGCDGVIFFDMAESVLWEAMMEFFGLDIHLCWIGMGEGMQSVWVHGRWHLCLWHSAHHFLDAVFHRLEDTEPQQRSHIVKPDFTLS